MTALQIVNIDLKIPTQIFETELQDAIDNYHEHMSYMLKPMSTRQGKTMYKVTVDNGDTSELHIVAERDDVSGDIIFHPLKLSNMNESFYEFSGDPDVLGGSEDPCVFFCHAMSHMCQKHKGDFAYIGTDGKPYIIKNGTQTKAAAVALVDGDGNVYSCANAKNIKSASESVDFSVQKPIGEWLGENPEVQREVAKLTTITDKMNYIGKYLINARIKEDIDADEFMDIFRQAGVIGFSEPSVINIYKLLM